MQQQQTSHPDPAPAASSVSPAEIARFGRLAERWWDPDGPMRPLHDMNPLRIGWALAHLPPPPPEGGLRLLDIGCGAGLGSEALAQRGHDVLGIDASREAIAAAETHAALSSRSGSLRYRATDGETLLREGERFDAVLALEVIEHTADPAGFLRLLAGLVRPGGTVVLSTLNRTLRSLATAKIGAEYVARLLPAGTHDWRRFVSPAELQGHAAAAGLRLDDIAGMVPGGFGLGRRWRLSRDLSVNYIAALSAG